MPPLVPAEPPVRPESNSLAVIIDAPVLLVALAVLLPIMKVCKSVLNAPFVMLLATSALTAMLVRLVFGLERRRRVVVRFENLPFLRLAMLRTQVHLRHKQPAEQVANTAGWLSRTGVGRD